MTNNQIASSTAQKVQNRPSIVVGPTKDPNIERSRRRQTHGTVSRSRD